MSTSLPSAPERLSVPRIAWKILADSAGYRIKKREAANLFTSISLAVALGLPWGDIAYRLFFGALLNVWVYLLNDCFDVDVDVTAAGRDHERARFLADHRNIGFLTCAALVTVLAALAAVHSAGLVLALVTTVVVIVAYSAWLKRRPFVDILAMGGWGLSMALVGFPIDSSAGWRFAGLLGLLCMVTEAVQVLRDEPSDRLAGVRTTAVVAGPRATTLIAKVLMAASAAYASLYLHRYVGLALALGVLVPLDVARASRSWDALRVLFGLVWLGLLALYFATGGLSGWIAG